MTGFNDITSSDHCGFYLNVQSEAITNTQDISTPFPFERKIKFKVPPSYKNVQKIYENESRTKSM